LAILWVQTCLVRFNFGNFWSVIAIGDSVFVHNIL
jgi:hypothetical protein